MIQEVTENLITLNDTISIAVSDLLLASKTNSSNSVIKDWWQKYNCSHWVIEENGFQKAIRQDKSIRDFASQHVIFLE